MLNRLSRNIWPVGISAILSALATFYIPKILTFDTLELEFAPFYKEKFINVPDLLDGRVEIFVDGKPQDNLSVMDIYLFNRSHKDLKDFPITFEFYDDNSEKLPQLMGKQLTKPDTFPKDAINEIPQKYNHTVRYGISAMPAVNGYNNSDFIASFVFLGEKLPNVRVQSDYTDDSTLISIYEYDKDKRERNQVILILSVLLPVGIIFIIWAAWDTKRHKEMMITKIGEAAENLEEYDLPKETLKEIAINSYKAARIKKSKSDSSN